VPAPAGRYGKELTGGAPARARAPGRIESTPRRAGDQRDLGPGWTRDRRVGQPGGGGSRRRARRAHGICICFLFSFAFSPSFPLHGAAAPRRQAAAAAALVVWLGCWVLAACHWMHVGTARDHSQMRAPGGRGWLVRSRRVQEAGSWGPQPRSLPPFPSTVVDVCPRAPRAIRVPRAVGGGGPADRVASESRPHGGTGGRKEEETDGWTWTGRTGPRGWDPTERCRGTDVCTVWAHHQPVGPSLIVSFYVWAFVTWALFTTRVG
jgi:hypothetical protein